MPTITVTHIIQTMDTTQTYKNAAAKAKEDGHFSVAARFLECAGHARVTEGKLKDAAICYVDAADAYLLDGVLLKANAALETAAFVLVDLNQFDKVAPVFDRLGRSCLGMVFTRFNAKKHFLHAGMCRLAHGDVSGAKVALVEYLSLDPAMRGSHEQKLFDELIAAYEQLDMDAFMNAIVSYDNVVILNQREVHLLCCIKNTMLQVPL
jgi:hypothetical protein